MVKAVAVLGTGLMGAGMAESLARAGLAVTVWNRSAEKAAPLGEAGATVAVDPATAVAGADVVVTMLFDADAAEQVMREALPAIESGAVWVQAGTVGLAGVARLAELAVEHGVEFVDAPVLGTRKPAEAGKLIVLAAGSEGVRERVAAVFEAIGSRTVWVGGQPGDGHRLKLAANAWVLSVTTATAQSVALTRSLGLDPRMFLDVIAGGPLDCDYAQLKGSAMIDGTFPLAFALSGALKDSGLIVEAMESAGVNSGLMRAIQEEFHRAALDGLGDEDMAAVVSAFGGRTDSHREEPVVDETDDTQAAEPHLRNRRADGPLSDAVLRTMQEETDRLAEDMDEAREAAHAAHRANSMAPSELQTSDTADVAPVHGDGPVDPPEEEQDDQSEV